MRGHETWIGVFIAFAALTGCLPPPYTETDPQPEEPTDSQDPPAAKGIPTTGGGAGSTPTGGGSSGSIPTTGGSSGTPSPAPSSSTPPPGPVLEPGQEMIFERFEGTLAFAAKQGTLTVVPSATGKAGRICADSAGIGKIEWSLGPPSAGTYTVTASVRQDTSAPGNTWAVDATSWTLGPDTRTNQGDLAPTVKSVKSTVQVPSGAFAATFGLRIGTTPNMCMLVDDIRVVKAL